MFKLIRKAQRQSHFVEEVLQKRKIEEQKYQSEKSKLPPPFNKQHYAVQGQGGVVITGASMNIMEQNVKNIRNPDYTLTNSQCVTMKSVVDGLHMIHHGEVYIKEVLSHVVCLETYDPFQYVHKKPNEEETCCYYLITGTVEVTYDGRHGQALHIFQTDVLYTHSTGEYLGLVSSVSEEKDLAPPSTIYTKEVCELIKIDRYAFHQRLKRLRKKMDEEKLEFMTQNDNLLTLLSPAMKRQLIPFIEKEKYDANEVVLLQRELTEFVYFLVEGHCVCLKHVYLPQIERQIMLIIGHVESGQFFGEERVTHDQPNFCNIVTKSPSVCFKVHRGAFEARGGLREELMALMMQQKHQFPTTSVLRELGLRIYKWEMYKRLESRLDKDVHEDRMVVLDNDNLKFSESNQFYDFMAGLHRQEPQYTLGDRLLSRNHNVGDVYSSTMCLKDKTTSSRESFSGDNEEDVYKSLRDPIDYAEQAALEAIKSSKKAKSKAASGDLLTMTKADDSEMTVSATMAEYMDNEEVEEEGITPVASESEEIVLRAKQAVLVYTAKLAEKRSRIPPTEHWDRTFHNEKRKAETKLAVSRIRANMLARKLHRRKNQPDQDYSKVPKRPADLSIDVEKEIQEQEDRLAELNVHRSGFLLPKVCRKKGMNKDGKASRFLRKLSEQLMSETVLPALQPSKSPRNKSREFEKSAPKPRSKSLSITEEEYNLGSSPAAKMSPILNLERRRTLSFI